MKLEIDPNTDLRLTKVFKINGIEVSIKELGFSVEEFVEGCDVSFEYPGFFKTNLMLKRFGITADEMAEVYETVRRKMK